MTQFGACRLTSNPRTICAHGGIGCDVDHAANAREFLRRAMGEERLEASRYSDRTMQVDMQRSMDCAHLQGQINALALCVEFLLARRA